MEIANLFKLFDLFVFLNLAADPAEFFKFQFLRSIKFVSRGNIIACTANSTVKSINCSCARLFCHKGYFNTLFSLFKNSIQY